MRKFGLFLQLLIRYYWLPDLIPPVRIRFTRRFGWVTPSVQGPAAPTVVDRVPIGPIPS